MKRGSTNETYPASPSQFQLLRYIAQSINKI